MNCEYIVVIGLSAGGLVPLTRILGDALKGHGAYFILQHTPYDYQSMLGHILALHCAFEMKEAKQGLAIHEDVIYTAPAKKNMSLVNDKLNLENRGTGQLINYAFDIFLSSLMLEKTKNVIVVILSGSGSDGSIGIRGIRGIGGTVIAQHPATCEFPDMPSAAIRTGLVDYVAAPDDIAKLIREIVLPGMSIS